MTAAPQHCRKTIAGWEPVSEAARQFHSKSKLGQTVDMRGRRPRNPGHHRKLFALLNLLVDNTEEFMTTKDALLGLKAALGHGKWKRLHKRSEREIFIPDSIAYENMGQDDFQEFYDAAVAAVIRWWIPVPANDLREAVEAFAA